MILDTILRFFIILLFSVAGAAAMRLASPVLTQFVTTELMKTDLGFFRLTISSFICIISGLVLGGMVGHLLAPLFIRQLKSFSAWAEAQINKMPTHDAIAGVCGLALGLIMANLLGAAFPNPYNRRLRAGCVQPGLRLYGNQYLDSQTGGFGDRI